MRFIRKHCKLWCTRCCFKTAHTLLPDLQAEVAATKQPNGMYSQPANGLMWRCDRCQHVAPRTPETIRTSEPVD